MTVAASDTLERDIIDGVGPYPFSFRIFSATDLAVTACSDALPSVPTLLTYLTHYTVSGINDPEGGTITLTSDVATTYDGYTLDIRSNTPRTQPTSIRNTGRFLPEVHENALDRLARQVQDLARKVDASIRYPDNVVADAQMSPISAWIQRYLYVNSSGVLEPAANIGSTALTAALIVSMLDGSTAQKQALNVALDTLNDYTKLTANETTYSVTVTNFSYPPGDARRYGASPTATAAANVTAIQAGLNAGYDVYLHGANAVYDINTTLRMRFCGQKLYGDGSGDNNSTGYFVPRTTLRWTGASGGTMCSVGNSLASPASNMSQCEIKDLLFDGNALAKIAIEAYDDTIIGGSWRNKYTNLGVRGLTGTDSTAIYTGGGAFPNFAHDTDTRGSFFYGGQYGVRGAGARHSIANCTFQLVTVAAIRGEASSAWATSRCIFVQNGRDFDGSNIQIYTDFGSWFENSVNGVYRAATAHAAQFLGSFLHTASASRLMDMGNAAGNFIVKGFVNSSTSSTLIQNVNGSYEYDVNGTNCTISPGYRIRTQGVIRADNAAFAIGVTSDQANATGDGTAVSLAAVAHTENYDLSNSVANGTHTCPLFGYCEYVAHIQLGNLGAGHTDGMIELVTTDQVYLVARMNVGVARTASNEFHLTGRVTVPMDAADTAYLRVTVSGSTKTVTILSGGVATNWRTRFEGRLV